MSCHTPIFGCNLTQLGVVARERALCSITQLITIFAQHCVERAGSNSLARTNRRQDGFGRHINCREVMSVLRCRLVIAPTTFTYTTSASAHLSCSSATSAPQMTNTKKSAWRVCGSKCSIHVSFSLSLSLYVPACMYQTVASSVKHLQTCVSRFLGSN